MLATGTLVFVDHKALESLEFYGVPRVPRQKNWIITSGDMERDPFVGAEITLGDMSKSLNSYGPC